MSPQDEPLELSEPQPPKTNNVTTLVTSPSQCFIVFAPDLSSDAR
jgi:hypothetical protein